MKGVMLAMVLFTVIAQAAPSCGPDAPPVVGWIEAKTRGSDQEGPGGSNIIIINQVEYSVPADFWARVNVGDLVKYDKGIWSIVRKGG